ncbi:MAG: alpha-ketoglutarate-dependent dioxygenase AlkB [Fluviicola sp.]|nr:alpha-ketoglutarate-dependent dioxygenase AlkB [Fluviicola sp.]
MKWDLPNARLYFDQHFIEPVEANRLYHHFVEHTAWEHLPFRIFGKTVNTPRLEAYFATEGERYSYSGKTLIVQPFDELLVQLKQRIEQIANAEFNAVLINYYRDGNDSNGWHADDEKELGKNPIIASLSLGTTRRFDFKHNTLLEKHQLELTSGSLLIMSGEMQHHWKHQIAKTKRVHSGRINLTFRKIIH